MSAEPGGKGQPEPPPRGRRLRPVVLAAAALLGATALAWGYALLSDMPLPGFELSAHSVAALVRSWGIWGPLGIVGLMIVHSIVPFPAELVALAAGMIFGALWGTVYVWLGAMCGAWLAFGLARWLGRPFVEARLARRHGHRLDAWTAQQGALALFVSRLVPLIAFNLINYAAGLTNMSWFTFTWATGLGILPLTTLMVLMGEQMQYLAWWQWVALAAAALALWLALRAFRRRRERRRRPAEPPRAGP